MGKEYTNDSDGENTLKEADSLSFDELSSSKLEDISSQDFNSSHDDSNTSQTDTKVTLKPDQDASEKPENKVGESDPKYAWRDHSRTSEEFELSLEINDKDFLETVKSEYRSSSPSWANQKFKFPK